MSASNTVFKIGPNAACELTGTGNNNPGVTAGNAAGAGHTANYAATIAIDQFLQAECRTVIVPLTSGSATITTGTIKQVGSLLLVIVQQPASGSNVATFGTGFRSAGTVEPSSSKNIVVVFVSDGTNYNEVGRSSSSV